MIKAISEVEIDAYIAYGTAWEALDSATEPVHFEGDAHPDVVVELTLTDLSPDTRYFCSTTINPFPFS